MRVLPVWWCALALMCACMSVLVRGEEASMKLVPAGPKASSSGKMGTKILIVTEGRSGSTLTGSLFNLHPTVFYFYEPCRSLRWRGIVDKPENKQLITQCTRLVKSVLDCSFTLDDFKMLISDKSAVRHSAKLSAVVGQQFNGTDEMTKYDESIRICQSSIRVIKEIRFTKGVPDRLLYSEVKVLHLIRDPRAVLNSRVNLPAFCKPSYTTRQCIQPLCSSYRATLRCISSYLALLENRPYWHFYKFKRLRYEDIALDPIPWTQRIYYWAGLGTVPENVRVWISTHTEAKRSDGAYSIRRNASKVVNKWQQQLTKKQVRAVNLECGDILYQLNYSQSSELLPAWQTTPGSAIGGRVVPQQDASVAREYPSQLVNKHWNAWCGKLSTKITGITGRDGHTDECGLVGQVTFEQCKSALEKSSACSALSFKGGRCLLHDRTSSDFVVYPLQKSTHIVKMLSGVDKCLEYDAQLKLARHFYYGDEVSHNIPLERKFYIYDDAVVFNYTNVIQCYESDFGISPWLDERRQEMAQNTGSIWLHEAFKRHPLRTLNPDEAQLFIVPIETYVSATLKNPCTDVNGVETTHEMRMERILTALVESAYWQRNNGADHLVICAWWGAAKNWGKWDREKPMTLWKLMSPNAILATVDEYFARDWNKALVVPYVCHSFLTRWRKVPMEPVPARELTGDDATPERNVSFYFRGGMLHGVDCKKKNTWVRKAAFEAFDPVEDAVIVATENLEKFSKDGMIDPTITESQRRQARKPNYNAYEYVRELRQSKYCLHLRGDTSTSRRVYDALAAGCIPVMISDDAHIPFKSQINWDAFTVSILEDELMDHKTQIPLAILNNTELLAEKQAALAQAQRDLLYGYGSPFDPSPKFKSRVPDHLLQQAFELVPAQGRYRRFSDTFSQCTFVTTLWPG